MRRLPLAIRLLPAAISVAIFLPVIFLWSLRIDEIALKQSPAMPRGKFAEPMRDGLCLIIVDREEETPLKSRPNYPPGTVFNPLWSVQVPGVLEEKRVEHWSWGSLSRFDGYLVPTTHTFTFTLWTPYRCIYIPYWMLAALTVVLPARATVRWVRYHLRLRRGLCPECGYDIRRSPIRCPECGNPIGIGVEREGN